MSQDNVQREKAEILAHPAIQGNDIVTSNRKQNLFLIFITLTQLVQMMPLGVGINSGLAIGEALGASRIASAWVVASYPLTQGSVVLMGMYHARCEYKIL